MVSYTFINSHSQVSDTGPEGPLVPKAYSSEKKYKKTTELYYCEIRHYINYITNYLDNPKWLLQTLTEQS